MGFCHCARLYCSPMTAGTDCGVRPRPRVQVPSPGSSADENAVGAVPYAVFRVGYVYNLGARACTRRCLRATVTKGPYSLAYRYDGRVRRW